MLKKLVMFAAMVACSAAAHAETGAALPTQEQHRAVGHAEMEPAAKKASKARPAVIPAVWVFRPSAVQRPGIVV